MGTWKKFEFNSLPESEKWLLVYAAGVFPVMQIAKWTGEGRKWLISVRGDLKYFDGLVTHWMNLPEIPN